jgi:biotin carboxylase
VPLYLTALNPTDAVTRGFLPAAAKRGLDVVVLTDQPDRHHYADVEVRHCQVRDAGSIAAAVDTKADGLLSNSDHLQAATAQAAELLGLPGKDWRAAARCKNKLLTRRALADVDPVVVTEVGAKTQVFPAVVKPREGVASEDVLLVTNQEELDKRVTEIRARRDGPLIVEEYLEGPLHTYDTLGDGSRLHQFGGFRTSLGPPPFFAETALDWAPALPDSVRDHLQAQLKALGVGFGACHTEFVRQGDKARIIEVNYRLIGDTMDLLCAELLGVDLFDALIGLHLGEPLPDLPDPVALQRFARIEYVSASQGGTLVQTPEPQTITRSGVTLTHRRLREPGVTAPLHRTNRDYLSAVQAIGADKTAVHTAIREFVDAGTWRVTG